MNQSDKAHADQPQSDERWLVVNGRRWRRTDPRLPDDLVAALKSQLGKARSAVKTAKNGADEARVAKARQRVSLAKHGLGERGPYWWDEPEADRVARARDALAQLEERDADLPPDAEER